MDDNAWTDLALTLPRFELPADAVTPDVDEPVFARLAREMGLQLDEDGYRLDATDDCATSRELACLGSAWHVLHEVAVGPESSVVDHVVVGPGGVFAITSQRHLDVDVWVGRDSVKVGDTPMPYVADIRRDSAHVADTLGSALHCELPVTGVVALIGDRITIVRQPSDGSVAVQPAAGLGAWLESLPTVLTNAEVATVFDTARRSTTWTAPVVAVAPAELAATA